MTASVVTFPGQPLVAVLSRGDWHGIMLAKPGAEAASLQVSYPTMEEADREAREGAEQCGWKYLGVFDDERLRRLMHWRRDDGGDGTPSHLSAEPRKA